MEEFDSVEDAIEKFEKLYFEKTYNEWSNRHKFIKQPGKFYPIDVDFGTEEDIIEKLMKEQKTDGKYTGKLDPRVRDLVKLIFNVEEMIKTLVSMEIDTKKMPLGKLSKKHIMQGTLSLQNVNSTRI